MFAFSHSVFQDARAALILLASCLVLLAATGQAQPDAEIHGTYEGEPMYSVLPPNTIPAIMAPKFVKDEAATAQMSPDEPVLGVVIDGQARAYSLWQLDSHELVNDSLGGVAIAAIW